MVKPSKFTMETKFTPGTNVIAKIDGKEIGPIYLVQIDGDQATLQGAKTHIVNVKDIIKEVP